MPSTSRLRKKVAGLPAPEAVLFLGLKKATTQDWLMRALTPLLRPFNGFDPTRHIDPYPLYRKLAESGTVVRHPVFRTWMISGFTECEEALRSTAASADRRVLTDTFPPYSNLSPDVSEFFNTWILSMDPPDHTRIRKLVSRAFTPRSMAALEPRVAEIAESLLADTKEQASFDVVESFGDKFPIYVIGELLGLPSADWPWLKEASDQIATYVDPMIGFDPTEMDAAVRELSAYMKRMIGERRANPTDDLIGRLVEAEEDGDTLSEIELVSLISLVMGAGHETTTNFFGNSVFLLAQNPEQRALLAANPDLIENAVEELLRFEGPVQLTTRTLTADTQIGDTLIKAGSELNILLGAANRDPRQFDNPDTLALDRPDARSLSFGHGIHHCVGAAMARMEARVALPMLLADLGDYTIDDIEWRRSLTLRGPKRLVVRR